MNEGDQELVWVKIMVDGDLLSFTVHPIPEIAQFGASAPGDGKMKGIFIPQIPTVVDCILGDPML